MANVYLSMLGTTNYDPCTYVFKDGSKVPDVRFVQEATVKQACSRWSSVDRILVFTTSKAERYNWNDGGHQDKETGKPLEGLRSRLRRLGLCPEIIRNVWIPEGADEDEIWQIFQIISENLCEGDNIIFDITHGFRSIPMLALVILQYAKVIKNVSLERIYYGALEAKKDDVVPVFDLTPFDELLEWTQAIDHFLTAGNASKALQLAERGIRRIKKVLRRPDPDADFLKRVASKLQDFSLNLSTCRGPRISVDASELKNLLEGTNIPSDLPAFKPLLKKLRHELDTFSGKELEDGIAAAKWCLNHNLIQQGFTILQEAVVTDVVTRLKLDRLKYEDREIVSQAAALLVKKDQESNQTDSTSGELLAACVHLIEAQPGFATDYDRLRGHRNDLNHAGWRPNPVKGKDFRDRLTEHIQECSKYATKSSEGA